MNQYQSNQYRRPLATSRSIRPVQRARGFGPSPSGGATIINNGPDALDIAAGIVLADAIMDDNNSSYNEPDTSSSYDDSSSDGGGYDGE